MCNAEESSRCHCLKGKQRSNKASSQHHSDEPELGPILIGDYLWAKHLRIH